MLFHMILDHTHTSLGLILVLGLSTFFQDSYMGRGTLSHFNIRLKRSVDQCSLTYKKKKSKVLKSYFEDAGSCCVEFLDNGGRQVAVSSALPGEYVLIRALQPMLGR